MHYYSHARIMFGFSDSGALKPRTTTPMITLTKKKSTKISSVKVIMTNTLLTTRR